MNQVGLSGLSLYVPPLRVRLEDWCQWSDQPWEKIQAVVGRSFRIPGPWENVYTMSASAVLRLILQQDIDPRQVRYLALGTESSTDNAAGAVVVKGLVNQALDAHGLPRLSRACEVPEFKHACLGGVYGLKGAARFLAFEPEESVAIVVSGDIAEYARGSSGEPTQGAGAVAMLVDRRARLAALDLAGCGSSSDYRIVDFRKPAARILAQSGRINGRIQDFPVFNGKYSTTCYTDATLHAMIDLFERKQVAGASYLRDLGHVLMHRPYRRMPETGLALTYLMALARGDADDRAELAEYARACELDPQALVEELSQSADLEALVADTRINDDAYPLAMLAMRAFRRDPRYTRYVSERLELGAEPMMDIGNLYTAALPAWVASAFEDAWRREIDLDGEDLLLLGYGSGDAAEALPMTVGPHWQEPAARIGFAAALENPVDLDERAYCELHDHGAIKDLEEPGQGFRMVGMGQRDEGPMVDFGIEYYRYDS